MIREELFYQMIFKRKSFHLFRDHKTKEYFSEFYKITLIVTKILEIAHWVAAGSWQLQVYVRPWLLNGLDISLSITIRIVVGAEATEASIDFGGFIIGTIVLCLTQFFVHGAELEKDVDGLL